MLPEQAETPHHLGRPRVMLVLTMAREVEPPDKQPARVLDGGTMFAVGQRVLVKDSNSIFFGRCGTVLEGPERKERNYVFDYLVKLDDIAENGATQFVGYEDELLPIDTGILGVAAEGAK